jgi:hypothetical protein
VEREHRASRTTTIDQKIAAALAKVRATRGATAPAALRPPPAHAHALRCVSRGAAAAQRNPGGTTCTHTLRLPRRCFISPRCAHPMR